MKRCLELAQLAKGHTAPNPMVGAVLVHKGRVIGEGWHRIYGQAHAEVNCFESVAPADRHLIPQSIMYVSLEPCAHYGKTPPCSLRIVQEKVKKVIIANVDPFEKVGGRGIDILRSNNIEAITGVLDDEGKWLNRRFYCFHTQKRPYIILKWAQSANGFIAPADKSRLQLSNRHSMQLVHKWRTEEAAIMVGYQTALSDNPQLTSRHWKGNQPLRIVTDRMLRLPSSHFLFDQTVPTWVLNEQKEEVDDKVHYIKQSGNDLQALMNKLHAVNKLSIIIEGGPALLKSFIDAGLWDEARIFTAAKSISDGIAAPLLKNAALAAKTDLEDDQLNVYVNQSSAYPYVNGMPL
ncbi:bifunctional diaminohydroxyphosphoribosylaminopyrimidine deaminase/5-amino-6-(5-phosphoribosylamino)uracil reductase RibD [Taibaiella soli]|uniref:Riboflavin biosynthesis protein RibD n=2 Tax=Taibaiella soli TaxID=1649169 RepID=A0A2W2AMK7_9BACT|nr:bifunctional diaminohydroxyphosphoribosylaminopyrimidine deaminase/5-amino-6-(5-phosphoribosylamino)uracil reductase RibD [Taibaiella soli]